MNNFQDNNSTSFGFNSDSHDPFDPFGLGDSSVQSSHTNADSNTSKTEPQASISDDSNPTPPPKSKKDDSGVRVKTVKSDDTDSSSEESKEDKTPANFKIGQNSQEIRIKLKPHNLSFNEEYFLKLLAGSISLNRDEKKRILDSIPNLRQSQINQLIEIFEDEKRKFAELPEKHQKELEKLDKKHHQDWLSIEDEYLQGEKKEEDNAKADEIRKKLGL